MDIGWVRHSQEHLSAALRDSDAYLSASPAVEASIVNTHRVLSKLWDLIPMTTENAFSGNLAPIIEADHELKTSITLASIGLYKQALTTLRSVLELGLLSVYWDVDDQAHVDIQGWWRGAERTPRDREVREGLSRIDGVAAYLEHDAEFFTRAGNTAYRLGGYVHTRGAAHSRGSLVRSTNVPAFDQTAFELWVGQLVEVGRIVLAIHLMKYPVGLQVTPLSEKFGLNPPAGGFVEPWVRDLFRDYLEPEMRDALQNISDHDENAQEMAAWINQQDDLTDEEWRAQMESHDRMMIEHGGYENWAKNHMHVDEHMGDGLSAVEAADRESYRERLRVWAVDGGMLTLDEAVATMRRRLQDEATSDI